MNATLRKLIIISVLCDNFLFYQLNYVLAFIVRNFFRRGWGFHQGNCNDKCC